MIIQLLSILIKIKTLLQGMDSKKQRETLEFEAKGFSFLGPVAVNCLKKREESLINEGDRERENNLH